MRIRSKTAALLAVLAAVAGFIAVDAANDTPVAERPSDKARLTGPAEPNPQQAAAADAPRADAEGFVLPERPALGKSQSLLFESQTWQPPPPPPAPPSARVKPAPPPPPTAPPVPYTYAGRMVHDGRQSMLLAKGDEVVAVQPGETLDSIYRVESITDTQITLVYLPLGQKQTIPVFTALAEQPPARAPLAAGATGPLPAPFAGSPSAPIPSAKVITPAAPPGPAAGQATLAWTGPQQVKLGTRFEVTLRVSSTQPLQAWPMQLRIDPDHFEIVTVKPGKLPGGANPNFTYRLNPGGNLFIGASVQQPAAGPNSELLELTLMPLKAASAAEVTVSSLNLQGPAGRPIPHDRVAAFRTAITP
jgi:hypothetical protein